ncbi:hypothetical protein JTB14_015631 [Gonioctena quinquepunctata]|nr:hypothetical protein JTB14_015631 [Gonioctena quinquepunctata]
MRERKNIYVNAQRQTKPKVMESIRLNKKKMMEEDLSYTIRNIQQQLSANKTASCYDVLKNELQEQWEPIQQLHHEIMANTFNTEEHYLKSYWALKISGSHGGTVYQNPE